MVKDNLEIEEFFVGRLEKKIYRWLNVGDKFSKGTRNLPDIETQLMTNLKMNNSIYSNLLT